MSGREDRRPEFQRMLTEALAPSSDVGQVLVYQTSRFMRDATKAQVHKRRLAKGGVRAVATTQEFADNHQIRAQSCSRGL